MTDQSKEIFHGNLNLTISGPYKKLSEILDSFIGPYSYRLDHVEGVRVTGASISAHHVEKEDKSWRVPEDLIEAHRPPEPTEPF